MRKSKLTPSLFLQLMFYGVDTELKSLRRISGRARTEHALIVSKQAIDDRFSEASVAFVKELISEAITSQVTTTLAPNELQLFRTVRIKDSTTFGIHDSLASVFEGYGKGGGKSSKAGISIQYEFDIKSNKVFDIDLNSAVMNDSKDAILKKGNIQKGDLIIRDLGYYSDQVIDQVVTHKAFFLSRLYSNSTVWVDNQSKERVNFQAIYNQMIQTHCPQMEMNVFIGAKRRPVRLIIELMPDEIYQKRITKRKKQVKSSGATITEDFKIRARFNLFICNIPSNECPIETISKLYRIRWQIELVFKVWKSILQIDQIKKIKKDRFITTMYLKLLWIFINWKIISDCRNIFYCNSSMLLSISKCFQSMIERKDVLHNGLKNNQIEQTVLFFIRLLENNHWSEKRKKRMNFEDYMNVMFCSTSI